MQVKWLLLTPAPAQVPPQQCGLGDPASSPKGSQTPTSGSPSGPDISNHLSQTQVKGPGPQEGLPSASWKSAPHKHLSDLETNFWLPLTSSPEGEPLSQRSWQAHLSPEMRHLGQHHSWPPHQLLVHTRWPCRVLGSLWESNTSRPSMEALPNASEAQPQLLPPSRLLVPVTAVKGPGQHTGGQLEAPLKPKPSTVQGWSPSRQDAGLRAAAAPGLRGPGHQHVVF